MINLQIALRLFFFASLGGAFIVARKGKNKEETVKQTWTTFPSAEVMRVQRLLELIVQSCRNLRGDLRVLEVGVDRV